MIGYRLNILSEYKITAVRKTEKGQFRRPLLDYGMWRNECRVQADSLLFVPFFFSRVYEMVSNHETQIA